MRRLLIICSLPLLLNGCAGMLVSAGAQAGIAAAENRSIGRKVDDTVIYTDLTNQFLQADQAALLGKVTFNVRYARVMLTGNVEFEEDAQRAVALSWKAKGVTEVINELNVNPSSSLMNVAEDSLIKRNLEARYLITKGVWVINYSIDVTNGTAYLIGRVKDQAELDRALNVARTTKGVKRVVSHLQINADTAHTISAPGDAGVTNTTSMPANATGSSSYYDPNNSAGVSGGNNSAPSTPAAGYSSPSRNTSGSGEVYTGPIYDSGSITSSPNTPTSGGY
jgi:osmotically-inducible protein OsmY